MLDWNRIIREKLGSLPLDPDRQDEIVEELANQLETAYQEELARGAGKSEAARHSLAQFDSWERLRTDVFESTAGKQLPIWKQNGILSPRRWPVWMALGIALAFLALPSFRMALRMLPFPGQRDAWDEAAFSPRSLQRIEQAGDQQKYARTLAYVALHSPDDGQAVFAAEKAIALDPQLTWISARVSHANYLIPGYDLMPWIRRLQTWDPENACGYLLEAGASVHADWETRWSRHNSMNGDLRRALAAEPRWRIPMEKAFSAPRMDAYLDRQFQLDRQVLLERGLDRPDKLILATASAQLPDFFLANTYADHLLLDVGERQEQAGNAENALAAYRNVAAFGEKLRFPTDLKQFFSVKLRQNAYAKMIPLLRQLRRYDEVLTVESALAAASNEDSRKRTQSEFAASAPASRSAKIILVSALSLVLLGAVATIWLICVALLRIKPDLSRSMNWLASRLAWAPALLPVCCVGLFTGYYPYARSIAEYAAPNQLFESYGPLLASTQYLNILNIDPYMNVWIDYMFWPLIWSAVILLAGALYLRLSRRQALNRTGVE